MAAERPSAAALAAQAYLPGNSLPVAPSSAASEPAGTQQPAVHEVAAQEPSAARHNSEGTSPRRRRWLESPSAKSPAVLAWPR